MQDGDAVGEAERHVHVVLDHDQRDLAGQAGDHPREALPFARREAGARLVEEQHLRLRIQRKRELEHQNLRLDATVNNISQGLCMYDAKGRLVICNQPYQRIYNLPERLLRPGTRLDEILDHLFDARRLFDHAVAWIEHNFSENPDAP